MSLVKTVFQPQARGTLRLYRVVAKRATKVVCPLPAFNTLPPDRHIRVCVHSSKLPLTSVGEGVTGQCGTQCGIWPVTAQ